MTQNSQQSGGAPAPTEDFRRLYEEAETRTAKAFEDLVKSDSFGEALALVTQNVLGFTRVSNDALDIVWRNMRVAGREDLTRVGRQLARTEDKLEMVLQQVEDLRAELREERAGKGSARKTEGPSSVAALSSKSNKA